MFTTATTNILQCSFALSYTVPKILLYTFHSKTFNCLLSLFVSFQVSDAYVNVLSIIVFFSLNFSFFDIFLFLKNLCSLKNVLLALFILSCKSAWPLLSYPRTHVYIRLFHCFHAQLTPEVLSCTSETSSMHIIYTCFFTNIQACGCLFLLRNVNNSHKLIQIHAMCKNPYFTS